MKKRIFIGIVVACLMSFMAITLLGCGGGAQNASETGATGADGERTTFAVGFDQEFPPYGYVDDNGQFTGFDLDLAEEVAKRKGWEVKLLPINWDAKDLELSSGSIDCIWNGFTIEGREEGYTWTEPYMDNTQVIVVKSDSGIKTLADLKGKTVMTQADSAALSVLEDNDGQAKLAKTFKDLKTIPEYNTAFLELESGAVDAVAIDLPVAKFQTQDKGDAYTILSEVLSTEHYGVGFLLGNTALRDEVQTTLKEMVADGTVKTIADKYAGEGISYDKWLLQP